MDSSAVFQRHKIKLFFVFLLLCFSLVLEVLDSWQPLRSLSATGLSTLGSDKHFYLQAKLFLKKKGLLFTSVFWRVSLYFSSLKQLKLQKIVFLINFVLINPMTSFMK